MSFIHEIGCGTFQMLQASQNSISAACRPFTVLQYEAHEVKASVNAIHTNSWSTGPPIVVMTLMVGLQSILQLGLSAAHQSGTVPPWAVQASPWPVFVDGMR